MIGYMQGKLLDVEQEGCTVLTPSGVGYELYLTRPALQRLPEPGNEVAFYVRAVYKDDGPELYGFADRREKRSFSQLTGVSKLGPRTALAILSAFDPEEIGDIVVREDAKALTRVQGIGPKSAKRIVWELKEKLGNDTVSAGFTAAPGEERPGAATPFSEALSGLVNLGYSEDDVVPVLKEILNQDPELMAEEAIRSSLQRLAGKKAEG
ncbi:MAG: Holliday junction branch migration protein RuvA [Desulfohalobiaceae bacterium]